MSTTRRTTRAASRQADSRAASPAPTDITATPRRTRRSGNTPLPATSTRQSTAYGTNTVAQPARASLPLVTGQLDMILQNLRHPDHASGSTASKSRPPARQIKSPSVAPSVDRSFNDESRIFNAAGIDSSSIISSTSLEIPAATQPATNQVPKDRPTLPLAVKNQIAQNDQLKILAARRLAAAQSTKGNPSLWTRANVSSQDFWLKIKDLYNTTTLSSVFIWPFLVAAVLAIMLSVLGAQSYGVDLKHNLGQFIPYKVAHPLDYFNPDEVQVLNRRLNDLEYQIARIKSHSHSSELDQKAIARLQEMIPDFLVMKKDKYGNYIIPDDFWHALRNLIRSDDTLVRNQGVPKGKESPPDSISTREVEKLVEIASKKEWDRFLKVNQAKKDSLSLDEVERKFPKLLAENHVVNKDEIIKLIRRNWEDNSRELSSDVSQLTKKLDAATRQIAQLQQNPSGLTKEEVKSISSDVLKRLIPHAQLDALIGANLKNKIDYGRTKVNHLSRGTGARVDPRLTSSNYILPAQNVWFPQRIFRWAIQNPIPVPNQPSTALMAWEEHGDCWCSASADKDGFGPSITVVMANKIYPDEIVVEHIPKSAALEPGAAPREMELMAYIEDIDVYNSVKLVSEDMFPDLPGEAKLPYRFVRIASWTYDTEAESVQAFSIPIEMKSLNAPTSKIAVRSRNNWGGDRVPYTCLYRIRLHGEILGPVYD